MVLSILGSCGIEEYMYLEPVDPGIPLTLNTQAFIRLPSEPYYFRYFIIYYRIYISGLLVEGTVSTEQLERINSSLFSDYYAFYPYTNTDNSVVPTTMGSIFSNRKYYPLALENNSIESYLGSSSGIITLDFARNFPLRPAFFPGDTRVNRTLTPINLWRYSESGIMNPYAGNRYFTNHSDLNTGSFINQNTFTNLDIANNNSVSGPKYTYVSMYIMAYGMDNNFSPVYSTPTFIGIFRLPD
ncbi:hypothetical protein LQZ19_14400 [Treponema primitia]|uniref:hypothetical protein n=1 Tax=Treponema primitia TaxID=88058 RepID=UPI003980E90F